MKERETGNGEQGEAGKIKGERRRKKKVGERKSEEQERLVLSYRGRFGEGPKRGEQREKERMK